MIHPLTVIDATAQLDPTVKVYQFATVCGRTVIGRNCVIGTSVWIGADCVIGESVRIQTGAFIPNGTIIGDRAFIGPNCTMTDDRHPIVENASYTHEPPILEHGVSLGAATVLLPAIHMARGSSTGAGAVVTHNVGPYEHVRGEPARVKAYSRMPSQRQELYVGSAVTVGDEHVA